ncbi:hypothetical protein HKO22_04070 [Peptoniphilus sp. AGMB00490]|uniref:Uncharacterized protein n=2 Tax=Peptoniphilus TaxID=162289 RepID=A0ACD6AYQ7_9FIRM|nr:MULTISPECIES: hypothetical protein [Peptoniphilus]NMW84923.1 hypothetical protein [Peptoniphilus faecalis]OLR64147.1 hypothetical protein BIV18_00530 [Peptoniphilus porci]
MKIFKRFKKKKSIYKILWENNFDLQKLEEIDDLNLSDGSYELSILKGEKEINHINTREINKAVDDYYLRESKAIDEFEEFFGGHRALESERNFLTFLLQKIEFDESKLVGLSILLMRDSKVEECVKFGMLLTKYYNLVEVKRAYEIFLNLLKHPSFIYYGIDVLKNIDYGIIDDLYDETTEIGKEIIEEKAWN